MRAFVALLLLSACAHTSVRMPAQAAGPEMDSDLAAVLKYVDPANAYPATNGYFDWSQCFQPTTGRSTARAVNGALLPACQPDTLYSWQTSDVYKAMKKVASGSKWAPKFAGKSGALFTHTNPISTYGYGPVPLRIKLKPGTKFKVFAMNETPKSGNFCGADALSAADAQTTVVVRLFGGGTDYILCSPTVIESWSTNTKIAFDEMVASALWYFEQSPKQNWLPYHEYLPTEPGDKTVMNLFISDDEQRLFDGRDFSQTTFTAYLTAVRDGLKDPEEIYYAPGVAADPVRHFKTAHPIYWNTRR